MGEFVPGFFDQRFPPKRLFKFTERRWAEQMLAGSFRIGTLGGYKNTEQMVDDIGDSGEGTATFRDSRECAHAR